MANTARQLRADNPAQRRQTTRDAVDFDTVVIRPGNVEIAVRLVDASAKGFHARFTGTQFERGESVGLLLPIVGLVPSRVMWGLRGCFGAQFLVPIDARHYLDLLADMRANAVGD